MTKAIPLRSTFASNLYFFVRPEVCRAYCLVRRWEMRGRVVLGRGSELCGSVRPRALAGY